VHGLAHERLGLRAEGEPDAARGAEEVRDDGVAAPLHAPEEERGAAALNDAAVDFCQLQVGVNFRPDFEEVGLFTEQFEKRAEVAVHAPPVNHTRGGENKQVGTGRGSSRVGDAPRATVT
jgi:hypothetical protein